MSITLKKDQWKVKDPSTGTYRGSAIFSTTLPEDAAQIVEDATDALDAQQIRAQKIVNDAQNAVNGINGLRQTMIASIASVAGQGTDSTLTQQGVAADAAACGGLKHKADAIYDTTSGDIASFPDGADDMLVKDMIVSIEPVQTGTGDPSPTNVRPISGWTGANVTRTGKNYIDETKWYIASNTTAYVGITSSSESISAQAGEYTFSFTFKNNARYRVYFIYTGDAWSARRTIISETGTSEQATLTLDGRSFKIWFYATSGSVSTDNITNVQLESGTNRTKFEPYLGITIPITFHDIQGNPLTVYGGTLELPSCVLRVTDANIASYNGETLPGEWISDRDVYAAGTTPTTGAQVVYKLAQPQIYQLTPTEVTTLFGQNNIWSNTGTVLNCEYPCDTKLYVSNKMEEIENLRKTIAPIEDEDTASKLYGQGRYFFRNGNFCKAKTDILQNAQFILNTNYEVTTVANELYDAINPFSV